MNQKISKKSQGIRAQRLNALAQINNADSYLEIGVCKGNTFREIDVRLKVGVDPRFQFDTKTLENATTQLFEVSSDTFFSKYAGKYPIFDLIYLDGLHTNEQTFRDFCASIAFSHSKTIWLIDDTLPNCWAAARRAPPSTKLLRKILLGPSRSWMGDVYKAVFSIHDFFPQYSYATFEGHGQTAVWQEVRKDFKPQWNSLAQIERIGYRELKNNLKQIMFPMSTQQILDQISSVKNMCIK